MATIHEITEDWIGKVRPPTLEKLQAAIAEFDALAADAARYRWLRDRWGRVTDTYDGDSGRVVEIGTEPDGEGWDVDASSLDAAIDAAMKGE